MLDLLCMGGGTVDLYGLEQGVRLEDSFSFVKRLGSSAANIAVGVSRLGLQTGMLTRVGEDAMGKFIIKFLEKEGVGTSRVHLDPSHCTGIQFFESNHGKPIMVYRENSADMALVKQDVQGASFQEIQALLITGICCSKQSLFESTFYAAELAKAAGCKLIFDIEYDDVLWMKESAKEQQLSERLRSIFGISDLIIGTEKEILVTTKQKTLGSALSFLRDHTGGLILQKRGSQGCIAYPPGSGIPIMENSYIVEGKANLRAGDAFVSGFLRGFLKNLAVEECCKLANANHSAMIIRKLSAHSLPFWEELQSFMKSFKNNPKTEQFHFSLMRKKQEQDFCILAFDHRTYFQKIVAKKSYSEPEVSHCKELLYQALQKTKLEKREVHFGCLIDDLYGKEILKSASESLEWVGRPIEAAGVFPLAFIHGDEASYLLRTWPRNQIVKVLCYIVDDENQMLFQIKKLHDLFLATQQTEHDLFVGLNLQEKQESMMKIHKVMELCYRSGITPAWWNLPLLQEDQIWKEIDSLLRVYDPNCSGILLYGHHQIPSEFALSYRKMKESYSMIKGCTCGRFLWGEPAEKWLRGEIGDELLISEVSERLIKLSESLYPNNFNICQLGNAKAPAIERS